LKLRVVLAVALMIAAKVVTIAIPYAFKWATDALAGQAGADKLFLPGLLSGVVALTILYGALRVLMALFTQGRDALFAAVAMNAVRRLAIEVFVHLHSLSLRFHLERKTGGLTRVLERGRAAIETIIRTSMLTAVPTIVEFAFIIAAFLISFDWRYVAAVSIMIAAYLVFTTLATNWRIAIRRSMNESDTDANTKAIDSLLNYETVKYFNNEAHETRRFDISMGRYADASVQAQISLSVLNTGQAAIMALGTGIVMVLTTIGIRQGHFTVGAFVMANAILMQLYVPLNLLGTVYREITQALVDMEAMFRLLYQPQEVTDKAGAKDLAVSGGEIRFDNVVFAYDPDRTVLKGISFHVPAGKTIAVVGPSGAGKSTISRILYRFYDIAGGSVTIDGQDIRDVTQASLRAAIGIVPQDTVLFNDTIRYNIAYGRIGANEAEIKEAARMAQIDPFIRELPLGYESMVGERGLKLSGGEKQRVAIARTILKNPPILLLDEATSALDTHTEREIQSALGAVTRNRTTLVIAHRLSTVVDADEILVLDHGMIVERGRHADLVGRGGPYAAMWNKQKEVAAARERLKAFESDPDVQPQAAREPVTAG
jgi:ABC-type transport system involved in Fe-S cluster assembly fused permease/ATPase subunit